MEQYEKSELALLSTSSDLIGRSDYLAYSSSVDSYREVHPTCSFHSRLLLLGKCHFDTLDIPDNYHQM